MDRSDLTPPDAPTPPPMEPIYRSPLPYIAAPTLLIFSLLLGALLLAGCGGGDAEVDTEFTLATPDATPVEVVTLRGEVFEDVIELTGTVDAGQDATLSPSAPGVLSYVAPVGAFVRAGQTVAQVDAGTQRAGVSQAQAQAAQGRAGAGQARAQVAQAVAQVEQARAGIEAAQAQRRAALAQLELAQDQYNRQRPLVERQIISPLEFKNAEGQLASARAQVAQADAGIAQARGQLSAAQGGVAAAQEGVTAAQATVQAGQAGIESAQAQLGTTRLSAPFSGVIEEQIQQVGELASPGSPVVRLVGGGGLVVEAGVPERYAGEIEVGTQVQITPSAYGAEARGGRVTFVGSAIDTDSRTFPIRVAVEDADRTLRAEMVVRMRVTRTVIPNALTLPQDAIQRDERGTSVYIVGTDSTGVPVAERRQVALGAQSGGYVVVAEGLNEGDRVVTSGQGDLADGDRLDLAEAPRRTQTGAGTDAIGAADRRASTPQIASAGVRD